MRLAQAGDRHPGPRQPRNGNHIWLVSCIVTVIVVVFVAVRLTGSGCLVLPRTNGSAAAAGAGGPPGGPARRPGGGRTLAAGPARARPGTDGQAVFYDPGRAAGSCGLGPFPAGGWYASLPARGYASGRACGSYVDVYGPDGTVRAEVVDLCPDCAAGTVDLSRAAFARIADPRRGTVAVSYQTVLDPPLPGPLMLRIDTVGRPGTLAVQVINHGNRLSSVAASPPGGPWQRLAPRADGYWAGPLRPGRRSVRSRAAGGPRAARRRPCPPDGQGRRRDPYPDPDTAAAGHQVVLSGISLGRTVLRATAWMYRAGEHAVTPAAAAAATAAPRARPAWPGQRPG